MSSKEYTGWIKYFNERPYGWREDHRAAILMQTTYQGKQKLDVDNFFPSLKQFKQSQSQHVNKAKNFINAIQARTNSDRKIKTD